MGHMVSTLEYFGLYGGLGAAVCIIMALVSFIISDPFVKASFKAGKSGRINLFLFPDGTGEPYPHKLKRDGELNVLDVPAKLGTVFPPGDQSATIRIGTKKSITPFLAGFDQPIPYVEAAVCSQLNDEMIKRGIDPTHETVHAAFIADADRDKMLPSSPSRISNSHLQKIKNFISRIRDGKTEKYTAPSTREEVDEFFTKSNRIRKNLAAIKKLENRNSSMLSDLGLCDPLRLRDGVFSFFKAPVFMRQCGGYTSKSLNELEKTQEALALADANQGLMNKQTSDLIKYAFVAIIGALILNSSGGVGGLI